MCFVIAVLLFPTSVSIFVPIFFMLPLKYIFLIYSSAITCLLLLLHSFTKLFCFVWDVWEESIYYFFIIINIITFDSKAYFCLFQQLAVVIFCFLLIFKLFFFQFMTSKKKLVKVNYLNFEVLFFLKKKEPFD